MSGKVLIIDDVSTNRIVLKVKLSAAYYDVIQAGSLADGIEMARKHRPTLVLASARLAQTDPGALVAALREEAGLRNFPIILILPDDDPDTRLHALAAGADEVLSKPFEETMLLARLRSLMRHRHNEDDLHLRASGYDALGFAERQPEFERPARVAVVASHRTTAMRLRAGLQRGCQHAFTAKTHEDSIAALGHTGAPDAFVLYIDEDSADDSLRLLAELRSGPATRMSAILAVLSSEARHLAAPALDMGANDVVSISRDPRELALRLENQLVQKTADDQRRARLKDGLKAAVIDPLTGLHNRRYALPFLKRLSSDGHQGANSFAVMLADLDHFKSVNDRFGHAAGDSVLTQVSDLLRRNLRDVDLAARIGGEEFLIVMPNTTRETALGTAARLCEVIRGTPIRVTQAADPIHVTVSIGMTMSDMGPGLPAPSAEALLAQADKALYGAKADGRNKVTISTRSAA